MAQANQPLTLQMSVVTHQDISPSFGEIQNVVSHDTTMAQANQSSTLIMSVVDFPQIPSNFDGVHNVVSFDATTFVPTEEHLIEVLTNEVTPLSDQDFDAMVQQLLNAKHIDSATYKLIFSDKRINLHDYLHSKRDIAEKYNKQQKAAKNATKHSNSINQDVELVSRFLGQFLRRVPGIDRRIVSTLSAYKEQYLDAEQRELLDPRISELFRAANVCTDSDSDEESIDLEEEVNDFSPLDAEHITYKNGSAATISNEEKKAARREKKVAKSSKKQEAGRKKLKKDQHTAEMHRFLNAPITSDIVYYDIYTGKHSKRTVDLLSSAVHKFEQEVDEFADFLDGYEYDESDPELIAERAYGQSKTIVRAVANTGQTKQLSRGYTRGFLIYVTAEGVSTMVRTANEDVNRSRTFTAEELNKLYGFDAMRLKKDQFFMVYEKNDGGWDIRKVQKSFVPKIIGWQKKNYICVQQNSWAYSAVSIQLDCVGAKMDGKVSGVEHIREFLNEHLRKQAEYDPAAESIIAKQDYMNIVSSESDDEMDEESMAEKMAMHEKILRCCPRDYSFPSPVHKKQRVRAEKVQNVFHPIIQTKHTKHIVTRGDKTTVTFNFPKSITQPLENKEMMFCSAQLHNAFGCVNKNCRFEHTCVNDLSVAERAALLDGSTTARAKVLKQIALLDGTRRAKNAELLQRNSKLLNSFVKEHGDILHKVPVAIVEDDYDIEFPAIGSAIVHKTEYSLQYPDNVLRLIQRHKQCCNPSKPVCSANGSLCKFDKKCTNNACLFLHTGQLCTHNVRYFKNSVRCEACLVENAQHVNAKAANTTVAKSAKKQK